MKNFGRIAVDVAVASSETSSHQIPQKTKLSLIKKYLFFTASTLIFCASLGLAQSVKAEGTLTVAGVNSTLRGDAQALNSRQTIQSPRQFADDEAVSALSALAKQIGTANSKLDGAAVANAGRQFNDQSYAALLDFAQRLGTAQPESIKSLPKLAEADTILDLLRGTGPQAPPAGESPKSAMPSKAIHSTAPVDAHFVGDKVCLTCHSTQAAEFQKTLMGRISLTQPGKFACENCHGPGSAHAKAGGGRGVGGIMSFEADDPRTSEEKNSVCLACHERGQRTNWQGSIHQERNLACVNCHTIMKSVSRKNQLKTVFEPDTCFQCHKDRRAQMFRSSHMPLREGKIVCSDCHNPHGSFTEALLKKDSINDTCYTCHAEKRGPFLFEHEPVRENCDNCHDPHGSINEYSLKISRPRLCFECHGMGHGQAVGPNSVFTMGRSCQNCHTAIHGSNSPAGGALQR